MFDTSFNVTFLVVCRQILNEIDPNIIINQNIAANKLMALNGLGIIPTATHTVTGQVERGELYECGQLQAEHEELFLISAQRKIENLIAAKNTATLVV